MFIFKCKWVTSGGWKIKNDLLRDLLVSSKADVIGLQEVNLNWGKIPLRHQWDSRSLGWWEGGHSTATTCNAKDHSSSKWQPGGCMITSNGPSKRRMIEIGKDQRGLGRWVWTRFRGKQEKMVRIISAYQCGKGSGPHTVFSQQRRYFDLIDDARHPRDIFIEELCAEIKHGWKWEI